MDSSTIQLFVNYGVLGILGMLYLRDSMQTKQRILPLMEKMSEIIEALNSQIKDSDAKYKADLDERLVQLTSENEKLKSEIAEFEAIDRDVEKEKMKIAQAVLRAQEKAESMEIEMRYKFDAENTRLENYKKEIDELRDKAMVILSKFEGELGEFIEENISKKGVAKIAK